MDNWSQYNQELKTVLAPLHYSIANDLITPKQKQATNFRNTCQTSSVVRMSS